MATCPSGLRGVIRIRIITITYALHALVQIQRSSNIFLPGIVATVNPASGLVQPGYRPLRRGL